MNQNQPLLTVAHLKSVFNVDGGSLVAVDDISFQVDRGKTICIVGESGCGKSVTALSIMRLIDYSNGYIAQGRILFEGTDLAQLSKDQMRDIRGKKIAMIFQEPMTALNPVYTVGQQIAEVFQIHFGYSKTKAMEKALKMMVKVSIPDPEKRLHEYPHQISGGMKQRIIIAMALACDPALLIADEPTTALDVTIQAQILGLMKELQQTLDTAIIFITHDLGTVAQLADEVLVMYAGQIIERGNVFDIFENPQHPYTHGLLKSIPRIDSDRSKKLYTISGVVPSMSHLPKGCRFHDRCPIKQNICVHNNPQLETIQNGHSVACHFPGKMR